MLISVIVRIKLVVMFSLKDLVLIRQQIQIKAELVTRDMAVSGHESGLRTSFARSPVDFEKAIVSALV